MQRQRRTTIRRRALCSLLVLLGLGLLLRAEPALARELECGQRIRRSVALSNDLLNCPGAGIVIGASGITVNLNGKTVSGDGGVADFGIDNSRGRSNVTIKNGTILNFTSGVVSNGGSGIKVKNVTANDNEFAGIFIEGGLDHKVITSTAEGNGDGGIALLDTKHSVVRQSAGTANGNDGIQVVGRENVVTGNTANDGSHQGITIAGKLNVIEDNETLNNADAGVAVFGNRNVVRDHTAEGNRDGVFVSGDNNRVRSSTASQNDRHGVGIQGTSNVASETTASDNGSNGFFVFSGSSGNTIATNVANDNGLAVIDGQGLGVDAQNDGNIRGFGTEATGNDNAAQCLPELQPPRTPLCNV